MTRDDVGQRLGIPDYLASPDSITYIGQPRTGRRELRRELLSRPLKTFHRPDPKSADQNNQFGTLPVRRAEAKKPDDVSARQWRKLLKKDRRDEREGEV